MSCCSDESGDTWTGGIASTPSLFRPRLPGVEHSFLMNSLLFCVFRRSRTFCKTTSAALCQTAVCLLMSERCTKHTPMRRLVSLQRPCLRVSRDLLFAVFIALLEFGGSHSQVRYSMCSYLSIHRLVQVYPSSPPMSTKLSYLLCSSQQWVLNCHVCCAMPTNEHWIVMLCSSHHWALICHVCCAVSHLVGGWSYIKRRNHVQM